MTILKIHSTPFQFRYKDKCGTDDTISPRVHLILKHLDQPQAYVHVLFVAFSSAFNTIQPFVLLEKMKAMKVNPFIIKWFCSFLTNRSQLVRVNQTHSFFITANTGASKGCVSSPLLYTLYTNDCTSTNRGNFIVKFADDSAMLSPCLRIATLTCTSLR